MLRKSLAVLLIPAIVLPGCVSTRESRIGTNDGTDACYQHRVALDATGEFYGEDMLKGAMVGAAAGAAAGLIARGGDPRAMLVGAVAGAALGAAGGYWNSKIQQGRDQAILGVIADARQESENLGKTQVALDQLVNCRRTEVAKVKADYKAKRVTKPAAEQRMQTIRQQLEKDYEIATAISGNVVKRRDEFLSAVDNITPGGADKIRAASAAGKTKKVPGKKAASEPVEVTAQSIYHVTTAYQTSERVIQGPTQFQTVMKDAVLEPA